jgi:hypothetical protein
MLVPSASVIWKTVTDLKDVAMHSADHAYLSSITQPCIITRAFLLFVLVSIATICSSLLFIDCNHLCRADLKSLISSETLNDLFRASLGAFVASSRGTYRFCTTPDCPSINEVSTSGRLFVCGSCSVELYVTCYLEYHPYLS